MNNIPWTKEQLMKANDKLMKQNKRHKQALEFYADKTNYQIFIRNGRSNIEHDGGEIARQALQNK